MKLPSWALTAGGVSLALAAGIMIGRTTATSSDSESSKSARSEVPARDRPSSRLQRNEQATSRERSTDTSRPEGMNAIQELDDILASTSRLARTQRLLAYLDRLPTDQFAEAYLAIASSPQSQLRGSERSLVLQAWAERDPLGALGHLQENGAEDWERETAVSTWAATDPEGAFAWASSSEDAGSVNNWVIGALRGMAAVNPDLARDYLVQMEPGETRERGLRGMERYITQYGFEYASSWINGVSDDGLRSQASRRFADELVDLDPAQAGAWNASIADTRTRRDVSETVADRWARQDLDAARQWVDTLPSDTQSEAAEGIARHYARQNPVEAANWLAGLGNDPDYDGAKRVFISESFRKDPETSLNFVSNLADTKAREGYYNRYLNNWMKSDAEAARQWASNNVDVLPENLTKRILR
ncbi:hypothetical protein [Haloferula rosea]|uniref:Uncharacterized protein n=1 Tax=Haloferula rosea TaxID=490093 RepID=A0A934VGW9_9BACT|nr:hypothetical protein [Haloferula rosea]MBK1828467.1 hypothetical protein [Haloferula rosea]